MKVLLAAAAVIVALLTASVSGSVLSATGEEQPARLGQARATADRDDKPDRNPAARAFVTAKKKWTACVAEAAPADDAESERFDPEEACGVKPHPHDFAAKHADRDPTRPGHQGPPRWAGGPDRRTAEPPGHATHD